jgi:hypothetical protein
MNHRHLAYGQNLHLLGAFSPPSRDATISSPAPLASPPIMGWPASSQLCEMLTAYDQAAAALSAAQATISSWIKPLVAMHAPQDFSWLAKVQQRRSERAHLLRARTRRCYTDRSARRSSVHEVHAATGPTASRVGLVYNDTTLSQMCARTARDGIHMLA